MEEASDHNGDDQQISVVEKAGTLPPVEEIRDRENCCNRVPAFWLAFHFLKGSLPLASGVLLLHITQVRCGQFQ